MAKKNKNITLKGFAYVRRLKQDILNLKKVRDLNLGSLNDTNHAALKKALTVSIVDLTQKRIAAEGLLKEKIVPCLGDKLFDLEHISVSTEELLAGAIYLGTPHDEPTQNYVLWVDTDKMRLETEEEANPAIQELLRFLKK